MPSLIKRDEIEGPTRLNLFVGRSPELTTPVVLLLGDAAHPMSPIRAQKLQIWEAAGQGDATDYECHGPELRYLQEVQAP
jgi:hypothetical protein